MFFGEVNIVGRGTTQANPLYVAPKHFAAGPPAGMVLAASIGPAVANLWNVIKKYQVPSGKVLLPLSAEMASGTAGCLTAVKRRVKLGTYNLTTNTWTANQSVPAGSACEWVYAEVATTLSAATATLQLTYTNQDGTTGRTTNAATMGQTVVGRRMDFQLNAADIGILSVQSVAETGSVTGSVAIYAEVTMAWARHSKANQTTDFRFVIPECYGLPAGEEVTIEIQASSVTAAQRECYLKYRLVDA